jgi:hypothetical protein
MRYLYIILALILFACLLPLPYGFYCLVRFVAMVGFSLITFNYYSCKKEGLMITFAALALLFQPFFKIALGRTVWNIVDILVGVYLLLLFYKEINNCIKSK